MITPNQIKEKELSTAAHGYDIDETNAFLNEIADSYSAIYAENKELYRKMEILAAKIVEYREQEDSIKEVLITAQKTASEVSKTAKDNADKIVSESTEKAEKTVSAAKAEAEKILSSARDYVANLTKEKTAAANEIATEAEKKASNILGKAKTASQELITKAKEEKEYHENLVSKLKEESEAFKVSLVSLYKAQLNKLNEMMSAPADSAKAAAEKELEAIENDLSDIDKKAEAAKEDVKDSVEKKAEPETKPEPQEKKSEAPAEKKEAETKPVQEQKPAPAEPEKKSEAAAPAAEKADSAPAPKEKAEPEEPTKIEVKNAEDIEDIKEIKPEENKASMIDVDIHYAINAFSNDEITPIEGHPVTEITEEPEMEPATKTENGEELPFETFFNVKQEGRTNEKISLIPPEDYDDEEEDLKFRGFFKKKKDKKHN
ncbi:MAG: DivIVA domain-containing protein [Eubacterium sp.]|nr:DivIVA domain-containing protein [Eubacterium sp.]